MMSRFIHQYLRNYLLLAISLIAFNAAQAGYSSLPNPGAPDCPASLNPQRLTQDTLPPMPAPPQIRNESKVFFGSIREKMPLFPGCDEVQAYSQKKQCTDSLLLAFIYGNLRYPYLAWRDSVEGFAVIGFYVEEDGIVSDPEIIRDPGSGTGAEALRIINLMVEQNMRWSPGEQRDKPVRVRFNMPVKFKLTDKTVPYPPPPPPPVVCAEPFRIVEQMPRFPGCEDLTDLDDRKTCADKKLMAYLLNNLKPTPLQKHACSVSGTVVIQFTVNTDGSVANAKVVRDVGAGFGQSALESITSMNSKGIRWIPGRHRGQAVPVLYNVPVKICLE